MIAGGDFLSGDVTKKDALIGTSMAALDSLLSFIYLVIAPRREALFISSLIYLSIYILIYLFDIFIY